MNSYRDLLSPGIEIDRRSKHKDIDDYFRFYQSKLVFFRLRKMTKWH